MVIDGVLAGRHFDLLVREEIARSGGKLSVAEASIVVATRFRGGERIEVAWTRLVDAEIQRLEPEERFGAQILLIRLLRRGRTVVDSFLERLRVAAGLPAGEVGGTLRGVLDWSRGLEKNSLTRLEGALRLVSEGKAGTAEGGRRDRARRAARPLGDRAVDHGQGLEPGFGIASRTAS